MSSHATTGHTWQWVAMLLASMAYTFLAPAWMAKKDRMPEPAPTSNTTWKYNKQEKGRIAFKGAWLRVYLSSEQRLKAHKYWNTLHFLLGLLLTVYGNMSVCWNLNNLTYLCRQSVINLIIGFICQRTKLFRFLRERECSHVTHFIQRDYITSVWGKTKFFIRMPLTLSWKSIKFASIARW